MTAMQELLNVHPAVVHFPIALLTIYALFEILRLPVLTRQTWYVPVKAVLLFIGFLTTALAQQTGLIAEEAFAGTPTANLVDLHEQFAWYTIGVYGVLSLLYVLRFFGKDHRIPFRDAVLILGAIAGLVLLTITGALGGALVYGSEADPIVKLVIELFYR